MLDRPGGRLLSAHLGVFYLFLYLPMAVLAVMSFNDSRLPTAWTGFSTRWYAALLANETLLRTAVNSVIVAAAATVGATVLGTLLAVGLERRRPSTLLDTAIFVPILIPDIVMAIALLSLYYMLDLTLGLHSIILAHIVFDISFVCLVVRARLRHINPAIVEASIDLGASEWTTFWLVVFPAILPGVVAGALLAFTISIDEFVIAYFTAGAGLSSRTFPMQIYSMIRFGLTPEINAAATIMLTVSITLVLFSQRLGRGAVA